MSQFSVLDVTVTIDSVDVSGYLIAEEFEIESRITAQFDTAVLTLRNSGALNISDWDEIIVLDGATKIFGGYVLNTENYKGQDGLLQTRVDASDFAAYLDHILVVDAYYKQSDKEIIQDLFSTHLSGLVFTATTYFTEENYHSRVLFNRRTLRECIDMLAGFAGAEWYIDAEKRLHFFTGVEGYAPYRITDVPDYADKYPLFDLGVQNEGSAIANRVEVVGGDLLSENTEFILAGTGEDNRVLMPFKMSAASDETALVVSRNDGTEAVPIWVPLEVKAGHLDQIEDDTDVLHFYQEKVLQQQDNYPALPNAIKVYGRFSIPVRVRVPSQDSYAFYGKWFDEKIVDADISDKPTARKRAKALLAEREYKKTAQSFGVKKSGLYAGQVLRIQNVLHDMGTESFNLVDTDGNNLVDTDGNNLVTPQDYDEFLIQSVRARISKGGKVEYAVESGAFIPNLYDLLLNNHRASVPDPLWNENERLDYLLETSDAVAVGSDSVAINTTGLEYYVTLIESTSFTVGKAIIR